MKLIFAPDSFKGSLSAVEAADILTRVTARHFPGTETVSIPVADGGEGTVDALLCALGGQRMNARVTGPLFETVNADWGLLPDGSAVIARSPAHHLFGYGRAGAGCAGKRGAAADDRHRRQRHQ